MSRFADILQLPKHLQEQARKKLQVRTVVDGKTVRPPNTEIKIQPARNKYNAKRVEVNGIKFDSRLEASHYRQLLIRERAGEIQGLRVHVKFALFDPGENCKGEYFATYCADFVFRENGKFVIADAKSAATRRRRDWPRTKKMMLMCHGHEVRELGV